jgi:hypothetical protein
LCADDIVFTQGSLSTFLAGPTKGKSEKDDGGDVVQDAPTADEPAKAEAVEATESAKASDDEEDTK